MSTISTDPYITIANLSAMLLDMNESLSAANALLDSQELKIEELEERSNRLQDDLDEANTNLSMASDSAHLWENNVCSLTDDKLVLTAEVDRLRQIANQQQEIIASLNNTIETAKTVMDEDNKNCAELKRQVEIGNGYKSSYNDLLKQFSDLGYKSVGSYWRD